MSEWISVKDRMPEEFDEVLFFYQIPDMQKKDIVCGHFSEGHWHICYLYESVKLNHSVLVTHWMPLPKFPSLESA